MIIEGGILYLVINAICSLFLLAYLPKRYVKRGLITGLFFYAIALVLPVLGVIFLFGLCVFLRGLSPKKLAADVLFVSPPSFRQARFVEEKNYGEGGAFQQLFKKDLPLSLRLSALFAVNNQTLPVTNKIYHELLNNEEDDLRLYAYSLSNKKNKELTQAIEQTLNQLKQAASPIIKGEVSKKLAFLFWERCYLGISTGAAREIDLGKARQFALQADELLPNDASLRMLFIKLEFETKQFDKLKAWFDQAAAMQETDYKILPYQAEYAFYCGDYQKIKSLFKAHPELLAIERLVPVINFWCGTC